MWQHHDRREDTNLRRIGCQERHDRQLLKTLPGIRPCKRSVLAVWVSGGDVPRDNNMIRDSDDVKTQLFTSLDETNQGVGRRTRTPRCYAKSELQSIVSICVPIVRQTRTEALWQVGFLRAGKVSIAGKVQV